MYELAKEFPMNGFEKHKGYVTKDHLQAINDYGVCKHHRVSFAPVKAVLNKQNKE